jgi:hypothetical protein
MRLTRLTPVVALLLALAAASVPPGAADATGGRTLYVATSGDDRASGTSIDAPWRLMETAIRRARPGDTILVRGGTYKEVVGWGAVKGSSTSPIRLQGYPDERVVIQGILQLTGADHWIVQRINVTKDPARVRSEFLVKFDGGTGWQFLDAEVWGNTGVSNIMVNSSGSYGIPKDWRIAGNCVHDNDARGDAAMTDHNIYVYPGLVSGPGMIERNIFFNAENGAHVKLAGPNSSTGSAYVTVRYNTMVRGAAGVVVGYATHHSKLYRNLVGQQSGGTASYIAAYIANHATGTANTSSYLAVWGYKKPTNAVNSTTKPIVAAGTTWVHPVFDSTATCAGFHTSDAGTANVGRYAP